MKEVDGCEQCFQRRLQALPTDMQVQGEGLRKKQFTELRNSKERGCGGDMSGE